MRPVGDLVDSALLEEITLLSEVIASVAGHHGHLDDGEVDEVLGVQDRVLVQGVAEVSRRRRTSA